MPKPYILCIRRDNEMSGRRSQRMDYYVIPFNLLKIDKKDRKEILLPSVFSHI